MNLNPKTSNNAQYRQSSKDAGDKKKKDINLTKLTDVEQIQELKKKGLVTNGTRQEKLDRLKKAQTLSQTANLTYEKNANNLDDSKIKGSPKSNVVYEIEKLKKQREERRNLVEQKRKDKQARIVENLKDGRTGDVEFENLIVGNRLDPYQYEPHVVNIKEKLIVCVRKRPITLKEEANKEIDALSCSNPLIRVHECKFKVDGVTKFIDQNQFCFSHTFSELDTTETVFENTLKPCIQPVMDGGIITCFAYGQTGSGKTYTMQGIMNNSIDDLWSEAKSSPFHKNMQFIISFYEIYSGNCCDLLNKGNKVNILEDKNHSVQLQGLVEHIAESPEDIINTINYGLSVRQTHYTKNNDTSSRSHAICKISLRDPKDSNNSKQGQLILVDLAGSERAQDTQENEKARRNEGAEINKSLLALKECIRAMSEKSGHIPFRSSKLTLALRDSFQSKKQISKIIMIACVCPGSSSVDHTLNTLYYADRLIANAYTSKEPAINSSLSVNHINFEKPSIQTSKDGKRILVPQSEKCIPTNDFNPNDTSFNSKKSKVIFGNTHDSYKQIGDINFKHVSLQEIKESQTSTATITKDKLNSKKSNTKKNLIESNLKSSKVIDKESDYHVVNEKRSYRKENQIITNSKEVLKIQANKNDLPNASALINSNNKSKKNQLNRSRDEKDLNISINNRSDHDTSNFSYRQLNNIVKDSSVSKENKRYLSSQDNEFGKTKNSVREVENESGKAEAFFRDYVEVVRKDSKMLSLESEMIAECSKNWTKGQNKNKDKILEVLKEKASMFNMLIKRLEDKENKTKFNKNK